MATIQLKPIYSSQLRYKGADCKVTLFEDRLFIERLKSNQTSTIDLQQVYAVHKLLGVPKDVLHSVSTSVTQQQEEEELVGFVIEELYCTDRKSNTFERKTHALKGKNANEWISILHQTVFQNPSLEQQTRNVLIFINPLSGPGMGYNQFMTGAKPILDRSHLFYKTIVTKRAMHAYEYCRDELDLSKYSEIVGVGGDGIIYEILNGVMAQLNKINDENIRIQLLKTIKIGVIPSGTSNALASAVGCQFKVGIPPSVERAALILARGYYRPLDIVSMVQINSNNSDEFVRYFGFLSLTWAFIADADLGTENLRWMGFFRNFVGLAKGIMQYKFYNASVSWLHNDDLATVNQMKEFQSALSQTKPSNTYCTLGLESDTLASYANAEKQSKDKGFAESVIWPPCPLIHAHFSDKIGKVADHLKPSVDKVVNKGEIRELNSQFFVFLASNLPMIAHDLPATPLSRLDDAHIDILMLRQTWSRPQLLNTFRKCLNGTHVGQSGVDYIKTKCFVLKPEAGIIAVDGEKVPTDELYCEVHPGLFNVFVLN